LPAFSGQCNIVVLALLHPAAQQNHDLLTVFAEVNSVARPKIDAALKYPATHTLNA
jgi:hypothetical protein